jgi:hypothetical protein
LAIGILFGNPLAQWKGTQNKSKIIQENLDTQNAAFHLLELPRAGKQF